SHLLHIIHNFQERPVYFSFYRPFHDKLSEIATSKMPEDGFGKTAHSKIPEKENVPEKLSGASMVPQIPNVQQKQLSIQTMSSQVPNIEKMEIDKEHREEILDEQKPTFSHIKTRPPSKFAEYVLNKSKSTNTKKVGVSTNPA